MTVDLAIRAAFNERRKFLYELVMLSSICLDLRSRFSPGDDWTENDEKISSQLMEMENVIVEKATALSIAATRHSQLIQDSIAN